MENVLCKWNELGNASCRNWACLDTAHVYVNFEPFYLLLVFRENCFLNGCHVHMVQNFSP